jgi:lysophospholipase L1-like esterase
MKNKFIYLAVLAAGFASCEPEFENEVNANYTSGDADFSTYVAVGNSLTAGYMDGTVSRVGQTYSFPNLLAQKFALAFITLFVGLLFHILNIENNEKI